MVPLWSSAAAAPLEADPAAALRTRYAELSEELEQSPLQRGLYLESIERSVAAAFSSTSRGRSMVPMR